MRYPISLLIFLVLMSSSAVLAENSVRFSLGAPYNTISPMKVSQDGYADFSMKADFESRPVSPPVYYSLRYAHTRDKASWELELLHHKLYLTTAHPDIQRFSATHGFNLLMINRSWQTDPLTLRIGMGTVFVHPENTVRNAVLEEDKGLFGSGQYVTGISGQVSMEHTHDFSRSWFATAEGKITYAYVNIPIKDGKANLLHGAIHGLIGIGYRW